MEISADRKKQLVIGEDIDMDRSQNELQNKLRRRKSPFQTAVRREKMAKSLEKNSDMNRSQRDSIEDGDQAEINTKSLKRSSSLNNDKQQKGE